MSDKLLDRIAVFDDSYEIIEGLRDMARPMGAKGYYPMEAATHIEGLWHLVNELGSELRKCQGKLQ